MNLHNNHRRILPNTVHLLALAYLLEVPMEEILVTTQQMIIQVLPQEQSCGSHRFGEIFPRAA